ncbi:site-specific integrase [Rossellomorea marisflavi]|uniref:site-specific integrase n=1 Tax=Rossellomorea marisflavi TaxID=189381 RepID=UPI003F9EC034
MGNQQKVQPIKEKEVLEDIRSYFESRSERDYFLFVLGINIGVRIGDLLKLQVKDVRDKVYLSIREEKTGKTKQFRINPMLRGIIEDYTYDKEPRDYLFPSRKTKEPISRVQAYRIMRDAGEALGLEQVGTHSLRKSFGFHLYQKTKDIALLQEIFNHSSERVTKIYIGIAQDEIDKVIDDFFI